MTVTEIIALHLKRLPEPLQVEVLDFIQYLETKARTRREAQERKDWSAVSLSSAMRGMEDELTPYSPDDMLEVFS